MFAQLSPPKAISPSSLVALLLCIWQAAVFGQEPRIVVDFGSSWGVGFYRDVSASTISGVDVDGNGSTLTDKVRAWPFRMDVPLSPSGSSYDSQLPSAKFYGGLYVAVPAASGTTSVLSEGHINQNHELRDDWNLMCLPTTAGSPELDSFEAAGIWLWKKEDFLNGASDPARTVSFSAPSDFISVFISRYFGGVHWGRWVIQNGGSFYISEATFANRTTPLTATSPAGSTAGVTKTAHTVNPSTVRWAPYDPTGGGTHLANPRGMRFEWTANPDYQFRTFDDVQAVGFLVQRDLSVGEAASSALTMKEPIAVKWNAVKVGATVSDLPAGSVHIDLVPVGGTQAEPQIWASRNEISYRKWVEVFRWAESNQHARNFSDGVSRDIPPYSFDRDGAIGSAEAVLDAVHSPDEPVASITWYDAAVWCNALSELEGLEPAYYVDAAFLVPFREVFDRTLTVRRDARPIVYWKPSAEGYRLPTEAEWRSLCAESAADPSSSWIASNAGGKTRSVGTLAANSHGLHDMIGNVAEYIWDDSGVNSDPATRTARKVMGGSFRFPSDENAASLIPAGETPWNGSPAIGFRPVRNGTGGLPAGGGGAPERIITSQLDIPADPAVAQSEEALRIFVRTGMPMIEVPAAGSLAPGSTYTALVSTAAYDIEVGRVEVPYQIWLRVRQWAERSLGYRFNYSGDMGSARWNLPLSRAPGEPVTNISWVDAQVWCNALSELMQLDPVYRSSTGAVERVASGFRLNTYAYYGYPNTGTVVGRQVDTAVLVDLLPDPIRTGYRLPTRAEAEAYGLTNYTQAHTMNYSTNAMGWFSDDPAFGGNRTQLKAMTVGTKGVDPAHNNLSDILGNVREWCFNGDSLFGPYVIGNDVGYSRNAYPHTMNRNEYRFEGRPTIGLRVLKIQGEGNVPPHFEADPLVRADAHVGLAYSSTIAGAATDPNPGDTLSYSKAGGPAWLAVGADGRLTGIPGAGDAGLQTFQVTATDFAGLSTTVALSILVRSAAAPPAIAPSAGSFEGRLDITFTTTTPGCTYRYTTDGSDPSPSHGVETAGTFTLLPPAGTLVLKAIAIHPSLSPSSTASANYTVTPGIAPQIALQPESQSSSPGANITLTVGGNGSPPLSFQWRRNGVAIAGATGASFVISPAEPSSTGLYSVVVSNDFGSVVSHAVEVFVRDGYTGEDPGVDVTPSAVQISALPGTQSQHGMVIGNTGGSPLAWTLSIPSASGGNYTLARSKSGGPALAWRDNVGTDKGGTKLTFSNADDGATSVAFSGNFTFPFYGSSYAGASVCTNGFITFNGSSTTYMNTAIPGASAPARMIAALWDDLNVDAGAGVWWRQDADAFVITWNNVPLYSSSTSRQTFQILLFPDGTARCQYLALSNATSTTVGIQNTTTTGLQASYNATTPPTAGEAITFFQSASWAPSASLLSGTIAGGAQQLVILTANTAGLAAGDTRTVQLTLSTNDPDNATLLIPVSLAVVASPAAPAILTPAALPGAVAGTPYATKLLHRSGNGTVQWSLLAGALPRGLSISSDGWISGTPTEAGPASFTAAATDGTPSVASRDFTITVTPAFPPTVATAALGDAQVSVPCSFTLTATRGLAPLVWSATAPLPPGLVLGPDGVVSGTPTEDGSYQLAVRVTDGANISSDSVLALNIQPPEPLAISTTTLPQGLLDGSYSAQLTATGGYGNTTWSLIGALPPGLVFSPGGLLSGRPAAAGITTLRFTATDRKGHASSLDLGLVVSATIPGRPPIEAGGWNLHDVAYWDQANMFADLMKGASAWQHNWVDFPYVTDAQGYPAEIPAGNVPGAKVTLHEPGQYVLTWRGNGTVRLENSALVAENLTGEVKRRIYEKSTAVTADLMTRVQILDQVPATDIHLWAPGTEPSPGVTTTVFHPEFLERLKDNSAVIRFMDWGMLNSSAHPVWASRRKGGYFTQSGPTAYEEMIALCNAADKDLWVCIPHTVMDADPGYVENLARLILTGTDGGAQVCEPLKPGLKVYVEWSNEVWNSTFPQFNWVVEKAKARLGVTTLPNYNEVWKIIGEYHAAVFKSFREEFAAAGRPQSQLVRVLATQMGGALAGYHMQGIAATAAADPASAADCQPDALAVGAYFGHDIDDWVVANVATPGAATAGDYDSAFAALREEVTGDYADGIRASAMAAATHGLGLVAYEGGQHVVGSGANASNSGLTQFLTTMNRDPRMGQMITLALDIWEQAGGGLFMAFQETGPFGSFGSWGFREYWHQTLPEAPKAAAFTDWMRRMQQSHLLASAVPQGSLGYAYTSALDFIQVGEASPAFSISSGALPPGLSLAGNGTISGIPLDYGDFQFGVTLDAGGGLTDTREYLLSVGTGIPSQTLGPAADAHVYSIAAYSATNYGNSTTLATHTQSVRYSHLRWDLSAFAGKTITRATLHLNRSGSTTATTGSILAYTPESAWGELDLTWSSGRPTLGATLATFPVSSSVASHSVDVTGWASSRAGSPSAGFALLTDQYAAWSSKESASGGPTLVIETSPDAAITTRWENWSSDHLGSTSTDASGDADADGLNNLTEYALGSDPLSPNSAPGRLLSTEEGMFFHLPFHPGQRDRRVRVQASTDLQSWDTVVFDSASGGANLPFQWNTLSIDVSEFVGPGRPRAFFRIRIDELP